MKKLIYLFLILISVASYAQAEFPESVQLTNQTSTTATKVNVQESNGLVNTIAKADLIEVLEYSTASAMPVTGVSGKIYVTIDSGRLYRWNGAVYNEISTGGVTSVSGSNGVTISNPTTTPIIGLGDITPTTVTTNSLTLNPVTAPSYAEGKVFYDSSAKTLVAYDDINGTSTNLGQELNLRARNNTGVTITNGSVVYISGATGQNPTIALARANSLSTSVTIGIATHDIANNTIGKITTFGLVNDLNTSAFTDGQILYVSPTTAGTLTATVPSSPNYTAHVCVVLHSHITQGKIFVRPEQPISLNTALTDNNNTSPSVSAVKSYIDTGLSGKISGSGTTETLPIFTASGVLGNSIIKQNNSSIIVNVTPNGASKFQLDGSDKTFGLDITSGITGNVYRDPYGYMQNNSASIQSSSNRAFEIRTGNIQPIIMFTNNLERARFTSNGNLSVGTNLEPSRLNIKSSNSFLSLINSLDITRLTIDNSGSVSTKGNYQIGNLNGTDVAQAMYYDGASTVFRPMSNSSETFSFRNSAQSLTAFEIRALTGTVLINTSADNGIDKIQVPNGTISALPATLSNQVVVKAQLDLKANISSPTFTGVPSVPTATAGTNTTQIASTAFVSSAVGVSASKWAQTGDDIINSNIGNISVKLNSSKRFNVLNSTNTVKAYIDESGNSSFININGAYIYGQFFMVNGSGSNYFGDNSGNTRLTPYSVGSSPKYWTSNQPMKYDNDKSLDYDVRTLVDKGFSDKNRMISYTVATLPTSPTQGDSYMVTDATSPTYLGSLTGGGTVKCPVFFNGTIWVSH